MPVMLLEFQNKEQNPRQTCDDVSFENTECTSDKFYKENVEWNSLTKQPLQRWIKYLPLSYRFTL